MANTKLNAQNRDENKNPRQIRSMGFLPGSMYGKGIESRNIQIDTHEFEMAYRNNKDGEWDLAIGKEKYTATIKELQKNYATNEFLNVEFLVK